MQIGLAAISNNRHGSRASSDTQCDTWKLSRLRMDLKLKLQGRSSARCFPPWKSRALNG